MEKRLNLYSTAQCTHKSFSRQNAALSIFLYRRRKEKWDWNELSPNFQVASIIESPQSRSGFLVFFPFTLFLSTTWIDPHLTELTFSPKNCIDGKNYLELLLPTGSAVVVAVHFDLVGDLKLPTGGAKLRAATCRATLTNINPNRNLSVAQW